MFLNSGNGTYECTLDLIFILVFYFNKLDGCRHIKNIDKLLIYSNSVDTMLTI